MKQRIFTALVLVPVLILIISVAPTMLAAVVWGALSVIGVYEMLYVTGQVRHPRMVLYSAVMAFAITMWSQYGAISSYATIGILVFWMLLFAEVMANHVRVGVDMVVHCVFAGMVVPYLNSALIRILNLANGRFLILIPFVIAFLSDAGAYFTGSAIGRHKLAPVVSPSKTIEGVFGGLITAVVGMLIYAVLMQLVFRFRVNYGAALLYGFIGSLVSVFGDLCFSVIKRQAGIKDYGNFIPGHGGFFDRFDSMVMVAPLVEAMIVIMPVVM